MMTHFFPEAFNCRRNGSLGERSNFGSSGRIVFDGKRDDAARVDLFPLVRHKDIVEVEKIQRADRLQLPDVRARSSHVLGDKRSKIALVQKTEFLPPEPPIENNRCRLRHRKQQPPGTLSAAAPAAPPCAAHGAKNRLAEYISPTSVMTTVEKINAPTPARTESDSNVSSTLIVTLPQSTVAKVRLESLRNASNSISIAVAACRLDLQP